MEGEHVKGQGAAHQAVAVAEAGGAHEERAGVAGEGVQEEVVEGVEEEVEDAEGGGEGPEGDGGEVC